MERILKYSLSVTGIQKVEIGRNAKILSIQVQKGIPCIWFLQSDGDDIIERTIETIGTGHYLHETKEKIATERRFIGTYQLHGGDLVFHAFEIL